MKSITAANYPKHPYYPAIAGAVQAILKTNTVVSPVRCCCACSGSRKSSTRTGTSGGFLIWSVCVPAISQLSAFLRILDLHARALGLKPSQTVYHKWGPGSKHIILQFSKSGAPALEAAYSRHYVARARPGAEDQTSATTLGATPDSEVETGSTGKGRRGGEQR